jgi:hypothetical protein
LRQVEQRLADRRTLVGGEVKLGEDGVGRTLEIGHEFPVDHRPADQLAQSLRHAAAIIPDRSDPRKTRLDQGREGAPGEAAGAASVDPARSVTTTALAVAVPPRAAPMVNGARDSLVPREHVEALYAAAREPKELLWVEGEHVRTTEAELLARLSGIVTSWLTARGLLPASP